MEYDIEGAFEKHQGKCRCQCDLCRMTRRVLRATARLGPRDRKFFRTMFREGLRLKMLVEGAGRGQN